VSKYPARAESLMRDRVRRLRDASAASRSPNNGSQQQSEGDLQDPQWGQMAREGMTALERFGAELESMFSTVPPAAPPPAPPPPSQRQPVAPESTTLGEIETELSRVLAEEGIVVRAHDVARVVSLMSGQAIVWDR
jgi:hypothetical protein